MSSPTPGASRFVYQVPDYLLPPDVEQLEVLVTLYEGHAPEVAMRPTLGGVGVRVWGPPLELTRAER